MIFLARYAALLQPRDLRATIASSVLGRLPIGITGLAVLLLVQTSSGSFARAGAAASAYTAGLALVAPLLGRLIDRSGPRRPLLACAFIFPAALASLVAAVHGEHATWAVLLCAAAAGASFPPITVCMRTYFRQRLRNDELLSAAYSLESVLIELVFIVGPLLVALFVAWATAATAVLFAAACGCIGTLLFLQAPPLRKWQVEPHVAQSLFGPLAERGFVPLVCVIFCYSMAFGLLEVGATGYAAEVGNTALAGVLLGLMSVGSALGGLAYGSRSWHVPLTLQFAMMLGLMAVGLGVLAFPWAPWAFAFWSVFAGVVMAPALIIQSMLVAKTARAAHMTEAFTWSASALLAGVGAGIALGGGLLERFPAAAALGAASAFSLAAAGGALLLRRRD